MDVLSSPGNASGATPDRILHAGPAKLPSCGGCPLERSGPFVPGEGSGASGMLLLGEAPGEQEVKLARPFVGPAGAQLDHLLRLAGLERPSLRLTNAVHSRPPKNELSGTAYEAEVIARCGGFLDHEVSVFRPRVIVALGNIPLKAARARHEDPVSITRARGFILDSRWMDPATGRPIPLVPTFHPSFLLPRRGEQSSSKWTGAVVLDLRKAARIAREGWERKPVSYLLDPPPAVASAFASEVEAAFATGRASALAFDIETVASGKLSEEERLILEDQVITRISFAAEPRRAITLPWQAPWMGVIERLLRSGVPKVGWNCFAANTSVWMADGSWRAIKQVAPGDMVRTLDACGHLTERRVVRRIVNPGRGQWVRVTVEGAWQRGAKRWHAEGVVCTPDHRWLTPQGWVEASALVPGTQVYLPRPGTPAVLHGEVISVEPCVPRGKDQREFCLEVEDTHLFFTRGGAVSNCHKFDVPVLERHGVRPLGEIFDGMLAWKVLQPSLPAGLEPTSSFYCDWLRPWKHESSSAPQRYSCMDADATVTNWIGIRRDLEANVVAA